MSADAMGPDPCNTIVTPAVQDYLPDHSNPVGHLIEARTESLGHWIERHNHLTERLKHPTGFLARFELGGIGYVLYGESPSSNFDIPHHVLDPDLNPHKSRNGRPPMVESPNVWETIRQFLNGTVSTTSKAAQASGKIVSNGVANGGSGTQRLKRVLPIFINGSRYNTTADTGSLENAISADEARRLGLKITGKGREFLMGNGSKTISLGIVRLKCAFALSDPVTKQWFNVIENLPVPFIIGKRFLDISKTLTLHQHRLEAVWTTAKKAFRVMHLTRPRQLMRCYVNGKLVHANPDTGSEVDLMSPSYAHENSLKIDALDEGEDWVQFADGSIAKLLGKTQVEFDVYDGRYRSPTGYIGHSRTFYLLEGLSTDVLLGEEALYEMNIFTEHDDSFIDVDDCGLCIEMNLITWFDRRARQMSDALVALSSASSKQMTHSEAQKLLSKLDARELHQRELANQKLAALPAAERPAQKRLEEARRHDYDNARTQLVQRRNAAAHGSN